MKALRARLGLALLCAGSAWAGCKVSVVELAPFPNPIDDAGCPETLSTFGPICTQRCGPNQACPSSQICTQKDSDGFCVIDCTSRSDACLDNCPDGVGRCSTFANQGCQELFYGSKRGCVPQGKPVGKCARVEVLDAGQDLCVGQYETVNPCDGGGFCPLHSACVPNGCACGTGYEAVDCSGQSCVGRACPLFFCQPVAEVIRCDTTSPREPVNCYCKEEVNQPAHLLKIDGGSCDTLCTIGSGQ